MPQLITVTKCLTQYFNVGEGKRSAREWLEELKAFTPEEKYNLAVEVCAVTGDELSL